MDLLMFSRVIFMMELCRFSLIFVSIFSHGICHLYVEQIVPDKAHTVNYIFITSRDYTWQEAREVCASLNASLIKIDTWEKYTRIRRLYNSTEYWGKLTNDFAWTGMTNTLDGYKWQGCEPYNFSTFVHFKDSGSIPFESNRQCYKTKKDLDFALEQKECTENNGAICEQHIEGNTCPLSTLISLELKDVQSKTKADCINTCESDVTCYAIVSYSNAECLLMKANEASEGSSSEVKIAIRQCIRVSFVTQSIFSTNNVALMHCDVIVTASVSEDTDTESENHSVVIRKTGSHAVKSTVSKSDTLMGEVKDSTEVITPTEVTDKIPHLNCGTGAGSVVDQATPSYVYVSASCHDITVVENVTEKENVTITELITITEHAATTDYITLTENVTMTDQIVITENVTMTDYMTMTDYTSVTNYITVTENITTTEYPTPDTITTTIISSAPYTVTVALSPTPSSSVCESRTTYINITNTKFIKESIENISKALYLDKKTTSAYVRLKTSAPDDRTSSMTMGSLGIVCIVVPFSLIFLADLRTIYTQVKKTCRSCHNDQLRSSPT